uniref:Histone chaperone domain-containing protein n=1 Tax=Periophthalmus magnuspinnatus TaxID=409849 RepID=A0A3B4ALJ4_9GOBI
MTLTEEESQNIRKFVCSQLRGEPDLSTLTVGVLKQRYLAHVSSDSLSSEAKYLMKEVVKEELAKMMVCEFGSSPTNNSNYSKMKIILTVKMNMSSDHSEDEMDANRKKTSVKQNKKKTVSSEDSDGEEPTESPKKDTSTESNSNKEKVLKNSRKKPDRKKKGSGKQQQVSSDKSDEEEQNGRQNKKSDKAKEKSKAEEKSVSSDESDDQIEAETAKEKRLKNERSDNFPKEENDSSDSKSETKKTQIKKVSKEQDKVSSDTSDDEQEKQNKKAKPQNESEDGSYSDHSVKKAKNDTSSDESSTSLYNITNAPLLYFQEEAKSVVRLKRYIGLCGVRRNYKKMLENCRSIRSIVERLNKELEDLGVKGRPTIEKCKKVRKKRERAQELSELDTSNIITSQGRPKRHAALSWHEQKEPPSSTFQRTLDSGSDSDQQQSHKSRRKTDWKNLQGIISDNEESD